MVRSFFLKFSKTDEAYYWIMFWLKSQNYTSEVPYLSVVSGKPHSSIFKSNQTTAKEHHKSDLLYVPSPGKHKVQYKDKNIIIEYEEVLSFSKTKTDVSKKGNISITIFGVNDQNFLKEFINMTQELFLKNFYGQTLVYVSTCGNTFEPKISRAKRDPSTVILEEGFYDSLVKDAQKFLSKKQWYCDHGIPFRRGYLLYGPPGNSICIKNYTQGLEKQGNSIFIEFIKHHSCTRWNFRFKHCNGKFVIKRFG
jgi:mitochondrial chaperone BCS1